MNLWDLHIYVYEQNMEHNGTWGEDASRDLNNLFEAKINVDHHWPGVVKQYRPVHKIRRFFQLHTVSGVIHRFKRWLLSWEYLI